MLAGCSSQEARGTCGESFCLPASAKLIGKQTPVEDFNLYQAEWDHARFGIYEGDAPQRGEARRIALRLPMDRAAAMSVTDGQASIIIKVGKAWPEYLDVMGPCPSDGNCPAKLFAAQLSRR